MARGGGTVSGGGEPGAPRWLPGDGVGPPTTAGGTLEDVDLPATTRIGREGRSDRSLRLAAVVVVAVLGLALVKPWDWGAPGPGAGETAPATPAAPAARSTAVDATPAVVGAGPAAPGTDVTTDVSCPSNGLWTTVVDEAGNEGRSMVRTWSRLDLAAADGPADPAMARVRAYAAAVPRIGFCAPTAAPSRGAAGDALKVDAWRLDEGVRARAPVAEPIQPPIISGGSVADGGVLYGAPSGLGGAGQDSVGTGGPADPEVAWSADGAAARRPGGWSAGGPPSAGERRPGAAAWPPGTYVFRVLLAGAGPGGGDVAWFAIDLRGPWIGPASDPAPGTGETGMPSGPGTPAATPATEPAATPAPGP